MSQPVQLAPYREGDAADVEPCFLPLLLLFGLWGAGKGLGFGRGRGAMPWSGAGMPGAGGAGGAPGFRGFWNPYAYRGAGNSPWGPAGRRQPGGGFGGGPSDRGFGKAPSRGFPFMF